jgi:cbb3-type cytochrome oxidase subunit 3
MDGVQVIFEYGADSISVYSLYSFRNPTDELIYIPQNETGQIPFIEFPKGSSDIGFEPMQESESYLFTESGFAIAPSDKSYGLVAFSSLAPGESIDISQGFVLPATSVNLFLPVGVKIDGADFVDLGVQTIQGFTYQIYDAGAVGAGETLDFQLSGTPKDVSTAASGSNNGLLIGAVALGIVLVGAGLWMYRQDKRGQNEEDESAADFESAEDVMDAILALDNLHSRKKISENAYQKRRGELKEILKGMI